MLSRLGLSRGVEYMVIPEESSWEVGKCGIDHGKCESVE